MRLLSVAFLSFLLGAGLLATVWGSLSKELQEHSAALAKNAEDMVAHGGMGDAKAIVVHAEAVIQHAKAILAVLPEQDPRSHEANVSLQQAILFAQRVIARGPHQDPGALLNPALKARHKVHEALKHLRALRLTS